MPVWTKEQQNVLSACSDTLLVSAAAGSGKTAVLVERVYRLLQNGGHIDRMLIVTFTRAAAGEMRERIEKRLSEEQDPHLQKQCARVSRAMISTLHAFCQKFLREQFAQAGIDPMFRLGGEHELLPLREKALNVVLENAYADPTADEQQLFSQFEDEPIVEMLRQMRGFLLSRADPFTWAREKAESGLDAYLDELRMHCKRQLSGAEQLLCAMENALHLPGAPERYFTALEADRALNRTLIRECEDGTLMQGATSFLRLPPKKKGQEDDPLATEKYKQLREEWKELIKSARSLLPAYLPKAEETHQHTLAPLRALIGIAEKCEERYFAYKKKRNLLDFSDLEHLTLKVLRKTRIRQEAAKQFDYIFVDEYQDVSGIQEAIVNLLHIEQVNTLFLVGDVKQSIYRFRLADPTLFLQKYDTFSMDAQSPKRKILLSANFRSAENVLLATNHVFSHAMRRDETEIEYDENAMLRPGGIQEKGAEVELCILRRDAPDGEEGEMPKGYLCEGMHIARRIRDLMQNHTLPSQDGISRRPIRYKDIVILLRNASGRASLIAKLLEKEGIPVYSDADGQYFDLPEVRDMTSLLRCIVNPYEDMALLSALRCPCFHFTEEELSRIRLTLQGRGVPFHQAFLTALSQETQLGEKCRKAMDLMEHWRFLSRILPLDTFIWRLMEESALYLKAGAHEDGEVRRANLRLFAERAQGENAHLSVAEFLTALEDARRSGDKTSAKTLGESEDVVRIMTLHKSKGLEFPIVFLMELARPFRTEGENTLLRMDAALGCALRYIDGENRLTRESYAMNALQVKSQRQHRAEEARLLYVGMTRAKHRLIMTGSPKNFEKTVSSRENSAFRAGSATCMLDWIVDALGTPALQEGLYTAPNGSRWMITFPQAEKLEAAMDQASYTAPQTDDAPPSDEVFRLLSRKNPVLPVLKTSVTALAHQMLPQSEEEEETPKVKRQIPVFLPPEKPLFLQETHSLTGAERGSVIHKALGLADLADCREGRIGEALDQLIDAHVFPPQESSVLSSPSARAAIEAFYLSPLGVRLLKSPRVHREWSFTLSLHTGEGEFVQGTIDLCFTEQDGWVLCDYKTDALTEDELIARYQKQLHLYALALKQITGMPVREIYLYSLHLKKALLLDET